ncbi:MAG: anion permease [Bacteroidetes bacterium HGW-Bacteroidetes-15]|nr:MAG: anion permease [Bacteroidetes bacterium HGW-Bacteroidetes-15]
MFLAINMGGSGTGPSFSAAYGANVIRRSLIPGIFGVMVFLGAILAGKETANTVGKGILDPFLINNVVVSIVFFAVAVSLLVANLAGIPQSTSQSTVFSLVAIGIYFNDFSPDKLFYEILPTWFILPLISLGICFLIGRYIYRPLRKRGYTISSKINDSYLLKGSLLVMSMYVAFAIGSNNVANAVGPITAMTVNFFNLDPNTTYKFIMIFSTLIIAPLFGLGSSIFGYKILKNTGKEIVLFGRIEAVIIAFVSASLLLTVSITKGIPTSLVQLNVGAILGIGIAKLGIKNIFRKTEVRQFFAMWVIAPTIAFSLSLFLIYLADIFGFI